MPSLEERESGPPPQLAHLLGRPPARSDHAEKNALEERLRELKEQYGEKEQTVFAKSRQLGISTELRLRMAAVNLGLTEDPVRPPIYSDDLPHR